ncbi:hypothetical protein, partial [Deinococcus cavernae]|uniref:hypothetical protein n=1 Tax=Deinococcus cavernae TaxID=2320857 RepID=UPI0018F27D17
HFWGSPVTPFFCNWAFNRHEDEIGRHWAMIPDDVDVLVTHGPAQGILDRILEEEEVGLPATPQGRGAHPAATAPIRTHS